MKHLKTIISDLKTFSDKELNSLYRYFKVDVALPINKKLHSLAEKMYKKGKIEPGETIFDAIQEVNIGKIKEFLDVPGININQEDEYRYTPLMINYTPEIVNLLLEHGANINAQNDDGNTALMVFVNVFTRNPDINDLLESINILINDPNIDINIQNNKKESVLYTAIKAINSAYLAKPGIIRSLIERGADVNNPGGPNPLKLANDRNDTDTILILLDAGATIFDDLENVIKLKIWNLKSQIQTLKTLLDRNEREYFKNSTIGKKCDNVPLNLAGLNSLEVCLKMLTDMIKHKPQGKKLEKLEKKYESHPYFSS